MPNVHIGVLGPLGVSVDGRPVAVPPGRRRRVLACLTAHRGHPVPVDSLIEAAWGDDLPHDPHAALHTVISRLRTVLGDALVRAGPAGYVVDIPAGAVDAGEFEERLARADGAGPKGAARLLEQALALWRGPAYAELRDAPFVMVEAMRLEGLRADATERLAALAVDAGDHGAATTLAEGLLAVEPYRERAVEVLVTALYRDGRQADALAECRRYRGRLADELGLDPAPSLARLEQQVLGHDVPEPPTRAQPPVWLDTSAALIGREDELADLVAAVTTNRLTVVTGPGGVGKSRLAAEALTLLHERLGLPTAVAELAPVGHGGVALTVAAALGLRPDSASGAADAVVDRVEARGGGLLVIDNCEHLLAEVSALVRRLVTRCRDVRILATSRRRLGVETERVLPLAPLAVPATGDPRGEDTASVRLVAHRVRRLSPTFAVTPANAARVGELCRRLDGLPLALELGAARVATRGLAGVVEPLVDGVGADGLQDVVAWSHRLLTPEQQELLACLSVFTGDFTAEEVRGLVAHLPGTRDDIGPDLAELVESSLVTCHDHDAGMNHRLLAIVRGFATDRLRESGGLDRVHLAHAAWVADTASGIAADWLHVDGAVVDARLRAAAPEMVTAIRWALDAGRTDLAARIAGDVTSCLHWTPGVELSSLFIEVAERGMGTPGPQVAGGVGAGAFFTAERGDLEGARRLAEAALSMAPDGDEPPVAHLALAVVAVYGGDEDGAAQWFSRMARAPGLLVDANASLALSACYHEDMAAARDHLGVALAAGACAADASFAFAHFAAGEIALTQDPVRGAVLLRRAAQEADRVGAEQVGRVARVALLAALARGGARDEAVAMAPGLLADLTAKGVWPQLWTALRMVAELLARSDRPAEAAFVLEASVRGDSAPPLVGEDVRRYAVLGDDLSRRLGPAAAAGIRRLAAATPRAHVVERAEAALAALSAGPRMDA